MNILNLLRRKKLNSVFTPSTIATLTYVDRSIIENDIEKFLGTQGMQIILFGHSGCGKSTLVYNKLKYKNSIITNCTSSTTLNDIIFQAFDSLDIFYKTEKSSINKVSISSELKSEYNILRSGISSSISIEEGNVSNRVVPMQITPQRLAEFMGKAKCIWIIEDFHKVVLKEKKGIADIMKVFMDVAKDYPEMKIVCIGAVNSARELVELDTNLSNRVAELFVPLMSDISLTQIIEKGFCLMNVQCNDSIKNKIIYYSNNLASVCHQICYDICFNKEITKTKFLKQKISEKDFNNAIHSYVRKNTDTFSKQCDKIIAILNGEMLLESFINIRKESITAKELLNEIKRKGKKITLDALIELLNKLTNTEFGEVIRYDKDSNKYFFSNPFFQTFIKMRFAIEAAEKKRRHVNGRRNYSLNETLTFDDIDMGEYIKALNNYSNAIRKIKIINS